MIRTLLLRMALAVFVLAGHLPGAPPAVAEDAASGLRGILDGEGGLRLAGRALDRTALLHIYEGRDFQPIWVASPAREAALVKALDSAEAHGLDRAAFFVPEVRADERDLLLTDAFLRYAAALAQGRIDPSAIEGDWGFPLPSFDAAAALDRAAAGDPAAVLAALAPADPAYRRLQAALPRYRAMALAGSWPRVPDGVKLRRGDDGPAVAVLRRRLTAEGYLEGGAAGEGFDRAVEAAVMRFQAQHGIAVDGAVGPNTFRALNVPAAARLEQIRDNLERWRELPRHWPSTRIEVNVPAAWLTVIEHGQAKFGMRTIVGAEDHPTPMLRARINAVLFNPPWKIPASIVTKEILPRARRDPTYLERNHYVYVGRPGASPLRQLPGPTNALGRVKFEMPNLYDVYLHDTPNHLLFSRTIRTLSHGCVRLDEPRQLALYALARQPGWGMEDIDRAIDEGASQRVKLAHSLPVYLLYWTAFVDPDGAVEFRDDIYGRDLRLAAALAARDAEERLDMAPTLSAKAAD